MVKDKYAEIGKVSEGVKDDIADILDAVEMGFRDPDGMFEYILALIEGERYDAVLKYINLKEGNNGKR